MTLATPTARERALIDALRDARDTAVAIGALLSRAEREAAAGLWLEVARRIDTALGGDGWRTASEPTPAPTTQSAGPTSPASFAGGASATAAARTGHCRSTTATAGRTTADDPTSKSSAAPATNGSTAGASRIDPGEG
jgi:hypothetical protein